MTDLRACSDNELLLQVDNDEYLYKHYQRAITREDFNYITEIIDGCFIYSNEQLKVLYENYIESL